MMIHMGNGGRILVATGLVASVLTMVGPSASPAAGTAKAAADYGGFSGEAWSTPVRIELYEPALPVPATPQLEFELAYSKVKADSGTASGRASYLWPGDVIGEGLRTFAVLLGLPEDNPITGPGYKLQVNSQYPGTPARHKDEPFPGMVMKTKSGDKKAVAQTGFSTDGEVLGPDAGEDGGAGGSSPLGGLQLSLQNLVDGLSGDVSGSSAAEPSMPGLPPGLAALVDVDGLVSVSEIGAVNGPVTTATRSALGEVRLLGGLLTIAGTETVARATTDGAKGVATGKTRWGTLTIAGQEFSIGPDGAVVAGRDDVVPGLDMLPADALKALGISFETPKPVRTVEGDLATSLSEGLRIIIETKTLAPLLSLIPAGQLAELLPDDAGPLKGLVSGLSTLAPTVVITLGVASATVDTVPVMDAPPIDPDDEPDTSDPDDEPDASDPDASEPAGSPPPASGGPPTDDAGPVDPSLSASDLDLASADSGLPDLYSFPGILIMGAIAAVAVAGNRMRRLGALGAGGPCSHGLDTGLPDLRRA